MGPMQGTRVNAAGGIEETPVMVDAEGNLMARDPASVPRGLEVFTFTCDNDNDGITAETAPIAAELFTIQPVPANCVGADFILEVDQEAVPYARGAIVVVGASDVTEALDLMATPNNGPGTYATGTAKRIEVLRDTCPLVRASWAKDAVARIDVGFLLAAGTGASATRLHCRLRLKTGDA